ncbi:MFS transporter [Candidatus Fermentibacteria bacterium]|nr:MFS transporter [Candidatus Fermentibacteria bacterium]
MSRDNGYVDPGRKTFLGVSSFQALAMFRRGLFYSYLSIYLRAYLGLSVTETTFFAAFPMVVNIIFQMFVWGVVSDRYQKRRTLIILGEISAAVITFLVWLVHSWSASPRTAGYAIIIGFTVVEIFWSMSNVSWTALLSDLYPGYKRAGIQGKLFTVGGAGRIIGVWIGGLAYDGMSRYYEGWGFEEGFLFFVASGVMLLSTIPMFFLPEGGVPGAKKDEGGGKPGGRILELSSYSKVYFLFLVAMILLNFGKNGVTLLKTQYLVLDEGFDVSSTMLSYVVNMRSVAICLGGLLIGRLTDWFNDQRVLMSGAIVSILSLLGFALSRVLWAIFVSNFLYGLAQVVVRASAYSYASKLIPPRHRGKQFALFNATFYLSWGLAGTLIFGPIVDLLIGSGATQVFSYRTSFAASAVLVLGGMLVLLRANRMRALMKTEEY